MNTHRYEIEPRPDALGGGWRLRLLEDETEVGGGIFPLDADLADRQLASDQAYADATQEGQDWVTSRSAQ